MYTRICLVGQFIYFRCCGAAKMSARRISSVCVSVITVWREHPVTFDNFLLLQWLKKLRNHFPNV